MLEFVLGIFTFYRVLNALASVKKSASPQESIASHQGVPVSHGDYMPWQLAHFDASGQYDSSVAFPLGLVVSMNPPRVVYNGQFDLEDASPPARYLIVRAGEIIWSDNVKKDEVMLAYKVHSNLIIIGENIMSYATGKSDFKDTKTYENQSWNSDPIKLQPVKLSESGLDPAYASDEVIVGVIESYETIETPQVDADGNPVLDENGDEVVDITYDITIMTAEADLPCDELPSSYIGQPLYVQAAYTQATATFEDIYSLEPPTSGFTHPLLIVTAQTSVHYSGTVRPEKV